MHLLILFLFPAPHRFHVQCAEHVLDRIFYPSPQSQDRSQKATLSVFVLTPASISFQLWMIFDKETMYIFYRPPARTGFMSNVRNMFSRSGSKSPPTAQKVLPLM